MPTATTTQKSTGTIQALNGLLADGYVFYQRLRYFHWVVTGPRFFALHEQFEDLYTRWATHNDDLAERILQLDATPLPTLAAMIAGATLQEVEGTFSDSEMVAKLLEDMTHLCDRFEVGIGEAEEAGDRTTANLLDGILDELQKDAWMLRSYLKG
jgi:starvation-inducible DNA-binding protein